MMPPTALEMYEVSTKMRIGDDLPPPPSDGRPECFPGPRDTFRDPHAALPPSDGTTSWSRGG